MSIRRPSDSMTQHRMKKRILLSSHRVVLAGRDIISSQLAYRCPVIHSIGYGLWPIETSLGQTASTPR